MNILCNVRANSELHSRAQCARVDGAASSALPAAACASPDAAAAEETYRASYGSIRVVPLTWGDDVPPFLHVMAPCCAQARALHLTFLSRPFFVAGSSAPCHGQRLRVQRISRGALPRRRQAAAAQQRNCNCCKRVQERQRALHLPQGASCSCRRKRCTLHGACVMRAQEAEAMFSVYLIPTSLIPAKFRHPMIQLYSLTALPATRDEQQADGNEDDV